MKIIKIAYAALLFFAFTACDPMHSLSVYNGTNRQRQLEVFGVLRDSLPIQQPWIVGNHGEFKPFQVNTQDKIMSSYTFLLLPKQKVNLELGFGTKPFTNKIIVDATDTVIVNKSRGRIKKTPFYSIGGDYVLNLKE